MTGGGLMNNPLETGVRVSIELPEAGTCVAVVDSQDEARVVLQLLDEIPEGELEAGATLELFMPLPTRHLPLAVRTARAAGQSQG